MKLVHNSTGHVIQTWTDAAAGDNGCRCLRWIKVEAFSWTCPLEAQQRLSSLNRLFNALHRIIEENSLRVRPKPSGVSEGGKIATFSEVSNGWLHVSVFVP